MREQDYDYSFGMIKVSVPRDINPVGAMVDHVLAMEDEITGCEYRLLSNCSRYLALPWFC